MFFFRAFSSGSISGLAQTGQFVTVMTEQEMCPPTEYGPVGHFGTLWYEISISTFNWCYAVVDNDLRNNIREIREKKSMQL